MDDLPFRYMGLEEVCGVRGGASPAKQWGDVKKGLFPPPDKVGSRSLWRSDIVANWLLEQARKADQQRDADAKAATERANRLVRARVLKCQKMEEQANKRQALTPRTKV
jgi:hypothetical protein